MGAVKKYRYVQTDLWEKSWFRKLGYKEKSLYLYFLTCPSSNVAGILEITDDRIKFDTKIPNIASSMEKLEDTGEVYRIKNYIVINQHPVFQKWEQKPNICKGIIAELEAIPLEVFKEIRSRGYCFELLYDEETAKAKIESINKKDANYCPKKFLERCNYRKIGKAFKTLSNPFNYSDTDIESDIDTESYPEFDSQSESEVYISLTEMAYSYENDDFSDFLKLYDQLYSGVFKMEHKAITEEQAERAKDALQSNEILTLDDESQQEMILEFFRIPKSDDYSLLHFSTDGILDILNKRAM